MEQAVDGQIVNVHEVRIADEMIQEHTMLNNDLEDVLDKLMEYD